MESLWVTAASTPSNVEHNLVYESNPDKLEASYGTLLPILVKAVQELLEKVSFLETKLNKLKLRSA